MGLEPRHVEVGGRSQLVIVARHRMMNRCQRQSNLVSQLPPKWKAHRSSAQHVDVTGARAHQAKILLNQPTGEIEGRSSEVGNVPPLAIREIFDKARQVGARRLPQDAKTLRVERDQMLEEQFQTFCLTLLSSGQSKKDRVVLVAQALLLLTHLTDVILIEIQPGIFAHRSQPQG